MQALTKHDPVKLARYEAARAALELAAKFDEIKDIRDKAVAMQAYARLAKDIELIGYSTDIRWRAEQRAGQMLLETKPDRAKGSRGTLNGRDASGNTAMVSPDNSVRQATLKEVGITLNQSSRWQKLAEMTPEQFEEKLTAAKSKAENAATSAPRNTKSEFTGEVEWYTPVEYIDLARKVLLQIDLDPASSMLAQKTVKAKKFYTVDDDGLTKEWHGSVWLNPPYRQPHMSNFMNKMVNEVTAKHVQQAIMLTHNYTDSAWFQHGVEHCTAICFTRGRIKFVSAKDEIAAPTQGQAFFYFGRAPVRFCEVFRDVGFVLLNNK
jgi:phage N-6-adenine-methyltransferase